MSEIPPRQMHAESIYLDTILMVCRYSWAFRRADRRPQTCHWCLSQEVGPEKSDVVMTAETPLNLQCYFVFTAS